MMSFRDYLGLSDACSYDVDDVIGRADWFGFQNFCSHSAGLLAGICWKKKSMIFPVGGSPWWQWLVHYRFCSVLAQVLTPVVKLQLIVLAVLWKTCLYFSCKKLVRSLQEDYRSRSSYVSYLVRSKQGLLSTLSHLQRLLNRIKRYVVMKKSLQSFRRLTHPYQLDEPISNFRGSDALFHFYSISNRNSCKPAV